MNKQMNRAMINRNQSGFTLIELIVVIVILGILAATALPKFADLGEDARAATLTAAKGSLSATAAMAHGKYLVTTPIPTDVTFEGATITFSTNGSGYPKADAGLAAAAGLGDSDYVLIGPNSTATTTAPATTATQIAFIPKSLENTAGALTCFVRYTEATAPNEVPDVMVTATGC